MPSNPTPDEERALRHDLLILELRANPQVRARLGRLPRKATDRAAASPQQVPATPDSPRA